MICLLFGGANTVPLADRLVDVPSRLPPQIGTAAAPGFLWWALSRDEWEAHAADVHARLQAWTGAPPIELHVNDALNPHHPSDYDYTSDYDLIVFRRLSWDAPDAPSGDANGAVPPLAPTPPPRRPPLLGRRGGPPILRRIVTLPISFFVYDRVLVSVHSEGCTTALDFAHRMSTQSGPRLPTSPADLMLRMVNSMVDSYLELRKTLAQQLDHWQQELLAPRRKFFNWHALLAARNELHALEDLCEEQHDAMQEWLDALAEQAVGEQGMSKAERDMLMARSRDVLEHIQRVLHHVRRLETSAETAVQMHFSAQSNRTNEIMRTLTALTAIFLPLNLITGVFGMNFEMLPLVHEATGFWVAMALMAAVAIGLGVYFWRKRYIA